MFLLLITLLGGFLRFYNLSWGNGFFFHPDERNMAIAISKLCFNLSSLFPKTYNLQPTTADSCSLNPHFFAYGQFPLYLAYFSYQIFRSIQSSVFSLQYSVPVEQAVFWLRFWSALTSTLTIPVVYLISKRLFTNHYSLITAIFVDFTPGLIQAAHFGTTESLLTFFFMLIVYFSIKLLNSPQHATSNKQHAKLNVQNSKYFDNWCLFRASNFGFRIFPLAIVSGLTLGTKLSAVFFLPVPILSIILSHSLSHSHFHPSHSRPFRPYSFDTDSSDRLYLCYFKTLIRSFLTLTLKLLCLCFLTLGFFFLASPYNFLAWNDFIGTSIYETQVAQGKAPVFYTQQFAETSPILYQLTKIFPYALGPGLEVLGILGSLTVLFIICQALNSLLRSYQKSKQPIRKMIVLLSSFLAYFLPNAFLFTKWTRFMTPIMPMFSVFASCFLFQLYPVLKSFSQKVQSAKGKAQNYSVKLKTFNFLVAVLSFALLALTLIPGLLFLTIYLKPDTRIEASDWIYQNIPESAYILSETANVVDIPIQTQSAKRKAQNYKVISFNFYDLDKDPQLLDELTDHLEKADYIFIPSQRIFSHVLRLSQKYPLTARYYQLLFSGQLGFERVAHFSRLPDEEAEETWSVFDHPAIRIYKKINPFSKEEYRILLETTKS